MPTNSRPTSRSRNPEEISTLEFYRELFAEPTRPLVLGPRPGLEPPALPAQFRRVRGGNRLLSYELLVGKDGRIAAKHENVAGSETYFIYEYDKTGHLLRVWRNGKLAEEYAYDGRGARVASWNARDGQWAYGYDQGGRLTSAGLWRFAYADDGSLREAWTPRLSFTLSADPDTGCSRIVLPGGRVLRSETLPPGLPVEKYIDAVPVESLTWRSPLQLATYHDRQRGVHMQFHYAGSERLPQAVTIQGPQGTTTYLLGYDQVGSLKALVAMDGEHEGRVVKLIDYDALGNILSDSNPNLFLPLAFAGGLRDRFTGLVRFCHRDYDPTVGRFTAPDPLGDTGADHDLYDYCVDEPVGRVDPEGLQNATIADQSGLSGVGQWLAGKWQAAKEWFTGAPSPSAADVTQGAAQAAADAAQAVTQGYDTMRSAGAQVSRSVPEAINNLPVSPKEGGSALKAGEIAQQVGAAKELDRIYTEGEANATARNDRIKGAIQANDFNKLEPALKEYIEYYEKLAPGALREGAKIAPVPVGPGPIKP